MAWSFIESFFAKDWLENQASFLGFSTNEEYFSRQLEQALEGRLSVDSSIYVEMGNIVEVTREDIQSLYDLVYHVNKMGDGNEQILKIIEEEAGSYFAGDKAIEEVSAIIQNRVNLYIEENKK